MTPSNQKFSINSYGKDLKNPFKNLSSAIITTQESSTQKSEITENQNIKEHKNRRKTQASSYFGNEVGNYYLGSEIKKEEKGSYLPNFKKREDQSSYLGNNQKNEHNSNLHRINSLNFEKWNTEDNKRKELFITTQNCSYQTDLSPSNSNKLRANLENKSSPKNNDQISFSNYLIKEPPPIFFTKHNEMLESLNFLTEMRKKLEINFFNTWERKGKNKTINSGK